MKKIFSILLCSALIFSILCVSVSAAGAGGGADGGGFGDGDYTITNLKNTTWHFYKGWTCGKTHIHEFYTNSTLIYNGSTYSISRILVGFSGADLISKANSIVFITTNDVRITVNNDEDFVFTFGKSGNLTANYVITWFKSNASLDITTVCTGDTCPVADTNVDGVCDTCGMATFNLRNTTTTTPDKWPDTYPAPPLGYDGVSEYILLTKPDGDTYLYVFTPYAESPVSSWNTVGNPNDSIYVESLDANGDKVSVKRFTYKLNADGEWYQHDTQTVTNTLLGSFSSTVHYSTLTLYNADGTIFFPQAPTQVAGQDQAEALADFQAETQRTMMILATVGVGCLALVISLIILSKKFRKFLY